MVRTHLPKQETQETQVQSLDQKDPLEEDMATHSSILPGESHGHRSLEGCDPWVAKRQDKRLSVHNCSLIVFLITETIL